MSLPHVNSPRKKNKSDIKMHNKNWCKMLHASFVQLIIYCFPSHLKEEKKGISVVKGRCFYGQIQNYEGFKLHSIVLTVCITIKVLC